MSLHNHLVYPTAPTCICTIICDAVNIEHEFVCDAPVPVPLLPLGMKVDLMCQYIEVCVDPLMAALQQPHIYGVTNPFPWMTLISLQGKTNFFEK
jgi:ribonucleoside-diphosphate reductase beta chain